MNFVITFVIEQYITLLLVIHCRVWYIRGDNTFYSSSSLREHALNNNWDCFWRESLYSLFFFYLEFLVKIVGPKVLLLTLLLAMRFLCLTSFSSGPWCLPRGLPFFCDNKSMSALLSNHLSQVFQVLVTHTTDWMAYLKVWKVLDQALKPWRC